MHIKLLMFFIVLISLLGGGCTALQTFPQVARPGDTVALAIGSPDGMNKSNTTASYIPDADPSNPIDLTSNIRSIFKLYADKTSIVYEKSDPGQPWRGLFTDLITSGSGHEPWLTVMVVDLPGSMPAGTGRVEVRTTATYPPLVSSHINDLETDGFRIDLEILDPVTAGVGSPNPFEYQRGQSVTASGDLTTLEPLPHALVRPPFQFGNPQGWPDYGAVSLKVTLSADQPLTEQLVRLVVDDMTLRTESNRSVLSALKGNELTVMLISPTGALKYYEPRFSIVLRSDVTFTNVPVITQVQYYDLDGNPAVGPSVSNYTVVLNSI